MRRRVVVLVIPPVDELDLVGPMEVFATANRLYGGGRALYTVEVAATSRDRTVQGRSGLSLLADQHYHEVRGLDKAHSVRWNGNVPTLDKNSNVERDTSAWWNAEDPLNPGRLRRYDFDGAEVKDVIGTVITDCGWSLKQVWRKKTLVEGKD